MKLCSSDNQVVIKVLKELYPLRRKIFGNVGLKDMSDGIKKLQV